MKRQVRIRIEYTATIDDAGLGVPRIDATAIEDIARLATPTATYDGGGKIAANLTRASSFAARQQAKRSIPA